MSGHHLGRLQNAASISGGKKRRSRKTHKKHYRKRNTRKSRYSKKYTRNRYNKRNQRKHTSKKYKKHRGGGIPATREEIRAIIKEFKEELGDEDFFDGKDEQIADEAFKLHLDEQQLKDGLYGWSKSAPPFGHI